MSVRERSTVFDGRLLDDGGGGAVVGAAGSAFAEYTQHLPLPTKLKIGAFQSPTKGCFTRPSAASFRSLFSKLPPDTLDNARRQWVAATGTTAQAIAIDGQDRKGARKPNEADERMTAAAFENDRGRVMGQTQVPKPANAITAARALVLSLDLRGRTVTLDAGPSDATTAAMIVADRGADEMMTAIKDNQPTRLAQRPVMPRDDRVSVHATVDQGHGRREWRRCWM